MVWYCVLGNSVEAGKVGGGAGVLGLDDDRSE